MRFAVICMLLAGCTSGPKPVPTVVEELQACRAGCLPFAMRKYVHDRGCVCDDKCKVAAAPADEAK